MTPEKEQEIAEAVIRNQGFHVGREVAAEAIRSWCRENWPVVENSQRIDPVIWNSMPETLAKIAEGEGLAASVRRSVNELLERERQAAEMGA
jgi:hypothetical protein